MIRVILPGQLSILANVGREIELQLQGPVTIAALLDSLEAQHPSLRGTIRNQLTQERRPFIRFFVAGEDLSLEEPSYPLPPEVATGKIPFRVVGAMAGG